MALWPLHLQEWMRPLPRWRDRGVSVTSKPATA
jgi:hypothetical protein